MSAASGGYVERVTKALRWPSGNGLDAYKRPRGIAALAAAVLSIGLGLGLGPGAKTPEAGLAWRDTLKPLTEAPITPGTALVMVPPPGTGDVESYFLVYEACWRRPDLLWSLAREWPRPDGPTAGVAVRLRELPPGWHEVWRRGEVCLAQSDGTR